jgi:hypothetical protein
MRYRVITADKSQGRGGVLSIDVPDRRFAELWAKDNGIAWTSIDLEEELPLDYAQPGTGDAQPLHNWQRHRSIGAQLAWEERHRLTLGERLAIAICKLIALFEYVVVVVRLGKAAYPNPNPNPDTKFNMLEGALISISATLFLILSAIIRGRGSQRFR